MESGNYDFGMVGLGVMGSNILLNMADHGYAVVGFDLSKDKTTAFEQSGKEGQQLRGVNSLQDMVASLKTPRKIMMLVPAGNPVTSVMRDLKPLLEKGDIIIDGGNSHYTDTLDRIKEMRDTGIHFMGVGISGGEDGARFGPSIMPGGDQEAWEAVAPVLRDISAKVKDNEPCVDYMGRDAAGHYVKMVHNGIEYGIMELISECYDLMKHGLGMSNQEIGDTFHSWDSEDTKSFLLEISSDIFKKKDEETDNDLVDMVLDKAGAKGTGKWTSESALELPMPIPTIDAAVMMRNLSSLIEERKQASELYGIQYKKLDVDKASFVKELYAALYFATVISYAQGLATIKVASDELKMDVDLEKVVKVWRGGCIIRSNFLDKFAGIYSNEKDLKNLLLDAGIATNMKEKLTATADVVSKAIAGNYTVPALSSAITYFNGYIRRLLPTNLVQAQRDYFGAHTYQRVDKEGIYHSQWK